MNKSRLRKLWDINWGMYEVSKPVVFLVAFMALLSVGIRMAYYPAILIALWFFGMVFYEWGKETKITQHKGAVIASIAIGMGITAVLCWARVLPLGG